jgi:hypothetical protein
VLDEGSARQLVRNGVADIFPLKSGDLTAIHGVGGHRCTSGACIARLSCWCTDTKEWVDFQLLAFVLKGSDNLRIIGNTFLRHHRAIIDVGASRVGLGFGERMVRTPITITTSRAEMGEQWALLAAAPPHQSGGGASRQWRYAGLAMDALLARAAGHAAALKAEEAPRRRSYYASGRSNVAPSATQS